jgi:hypothetical protein
MKKEQREKEELEKQLQIAKSFEEKLKKQPNKEEEQKEIIADLPTDRQKLEINLSSKSYR